MHLAVAAVLIPVLAGAAPKGRRGRRQRAGHRGELDSDDVLRPG
jgi:hypothetical protein